MAAATAVSAEYIWLSGADSHHDIRSKVRSLDAAKFSALSNAAVLATQGAALEELFPEWSFDGSSTGQAKGLNTEILVKARRAFLHPFPLVDRHFVVLCECFYPDRTPTACNTRRLATEVFDAKLEEEPWFAFEQEYVLMDPKTGRPYKWPAEGGFPSPQGPYYCSNGSTAYGRKFAEEHYRLASAMGIRLSGLNAEVLPAQWEYQVGPCTGIEAGDHCIAARWLLVRLLEQYDLDVSFHSKPVRGDWNGSGMHTNFSTKSMRSPEGGIAAIQAAVVHLSEHHLRDIHYYGTDNHFRLTGKHETASMAQFSSGVGTRHTSVRIPVGVSEVGYGYFEDRRPSASGDPYLISARLFSSSLVVPSPALDEYAAVLAAARAAAAGGATTSHSHAH